MSQASQTIENKASAIYPPLPLLKQLFSRLGINVDSAILHDSYQQVEDASQKKSPESSVVEFMRELFQLLKQKNTKSLSQSLIKRILNPLSGKALDYIKEKTFNK